MRKCFLIALTAIFLCLPAAALGNPYQLHGKGNCALFAWEMMHHCWPVAFNVPKSYDAADWPKLVGQQAVADGVCYEMVTTDRPAAGDFVVWPAAEGSPRGHVAFVTQINGFYKINFDTWEVERFTYVRVVESLSYGAAEDFPRVYRGCAFREYSYDIDPGMIFLTYKEVE